VLNLKISSPQRTSLAENVPFGVLVAKTRPAVFAVGDDKKKREGMGRKRKGSYKVTRRYFSYLHWTQGRDHATLNAAL